ncbi:MAG TPA: GIY-YIG nuclease family protein [Nitrospirota bacterium]|nr:GIY-YIG nuclease family protein [Nitrospirota bacterium]
MNIQKRKTSSWLLYLLLCSDGTLYTGITTNLSRRLKQHNNGKAARYTRSRRPVRVVFQEPCSSKSHALRKEHTVKSMTRKKKDDYIKKNR